jgi:hypothetical protein
VEVAVVVKGQGDDDVIHSSGQKIQRREKREQKENPSLNLHSAFCMEGKGAGTVLIGGLVLFSTEG